MRGLLVERGALHYRDDLPEPEPRTGESRVRVLTVGVCATDLALVRGYMGFEGIPGHEFVGEALDGPLAGSRVVGEINAACGACPACREGLGRHCPQRSVLGILGRGGAFAEQLVLPDENLLPVPEAVSTDAATFTEPLAAAFEIAEQLDLSSFQRAGVVGDGRLGLLCAHVLAGAGVAVDVVGRHPERSPLLPAGARFRDALPGTERPWDLAVEATGRPEVLQRVFGCVRPRGTVVLKTTAERPAELDLAPLVVDEIRLLGSRCGRFAPALEALAEGDVPVEALIDARFRIEDGPRAFDEAARSGVLKVLVDVAPERC